MDDTLVNSLTNPFYADKTPRVKFLCSFQGSILPRPQDGRLRYVGGETRIVCVPRDISFNDLMARMRELYEPAAILKYQQPDEDMDALVSVVNDDDVTHMMEEYDKLGYRDGFTTLRIFLFSYPDQDFSPNYVDGGEMDNGRRYIDALNSLIEPLDYRRPQYSGSPISTPLDDFHAADKLNSKNLEAIIHNRRHFDIPYPLYSQPHLANSNVASGQQSVTIAQRYNVEASWTPAYYSPNYASRSDPQAILDLSSSPSLSRHRAPLVQVPDNGTDRAPEEYGRPQVNHQPSCDHQSQYSDNFVWFPPSKAAFPGNIFQGPCGFDVNSVCQCCKIFFQRNHSATDFKRWHEEQTHMEPSSLANGFPQIGDSCVDCLPRRDVFSNSDLQLQQGHNEQIYSRSPYGETHGFEKAWGLQHHLNFRADEPRAHVSGAVRLNDHNLMDESSGGFPVGHHVPQNYTIHDDGRKMHSGHEQGNDAFHGHALTSGSHIHIPSEELGVRHTNLSYLYRANKFYQQSYAHAPASIVPENVPPAMNIHSPMDTPYLQQRHGTNFPGLLRRAVNDGPRIFPGADQTSWFESSQRRMWIDGIALDHLHGAAPNLQHGVLSPEACSVTSQNYNANHPQQTPSTVSLTDSRLLGESSVAVNGKYVSSTAMDSSSGPRVDAGSIGDIRFEDEALYGDESTSFRQLESVHDLAGNGTADSSSLFVPFEIPDVNCRRPDDCSKHNLNLDEDAHITQIDNTDLSFLQELVASAKQAKLESVKVVKAIAQLDACAATDPSAKISCARESCSVNADGNSEYESENVHPSSTKIEPTKAEEEAFSKGLQTIKHEDLEEIRELGSGTYGSVYHGKWKGCDVAIKRIKSSCFAGRPSERERLISDFWKEAVILSSLHHPNVVSFYGVVRDDPDESLATVTEFMVNGSLKRYLQKKDRSIDRRKRLLIAMDVAFGMEYLHQKNVVHFDLKCENLLVNMRDPHRPVCKIGDLGLSKVKQRTLVSGGIRGTLPWMAPELLSERNNMVSEKIDVYSFGIVMWELLTGDEPYANMHCASVIGGIVNNTLRPQIPTWCDPEWKSLMGSCWSPNPVDRPSFSDVSQRLRNMADAMNLK